VFSQHQRIAILILCEFTGRSHKDFCDLLPSYAGFCSVMGIKTVPHPSSLSRFAKMVGREELLRIITYFGMLCTAETVVALDSTALSNFDRSAHYERRAKDFGKRVPRTFTKASLAADADTLLVLACEVSEGTVHDSVHTGAILAGLEGSGVDVEFLVADKGYDAEPFHRAVKDTLGAKALIPPRENTPKKGDTVYSTGGKNRSEIKRLLNKKCTKMQWIYQLRPLIECVNSIIKRRLGSFMRAKTPETRAVRTMCMVIAYNINRVFDLGLVRSLLEA
jgi:transposase